MADGQTPPGDARVSFTVKELLIDMDNRHSSAIGRVEGKVDALAERVGSLEAEQRVEVAVTAQSAKTVKAARGRSVARQTVVIGLLAVLVNLPTALSALHLIG